MADTTETAQRSELVEFATDRSTTMARLAVVIFTDALLFAVWILVVWGAQLVREFAENQGVNGVFAETFFWVSSASTFLLAMFHIASDVINEFKKVFLKQEKRVTESYVHSTPTRPR